MDPNKSKIPDEDQDAAPQFDDATSPLKQETEGEGDNFPAIGLFQELRQKKMKEPSLGEPVPKDDSSSEVSVCVPVPEPAVVIDQRPPAGRLPLILAGLIIGIASLLGAYYFRGKSEEPSTKDASLEAVSPTKDSAVIESLRSKHNARDWDSAIPASRRTNPFSIEVSDSFLLDYSRPVLVRGTLLDVAYGNRNIEVIFALPKVRGQEQDRLILRCSSEQLELFADGIRGVSEYAVVANCYDTEKSGEGYSVIGDLVDAGNVLKTAKKQQIARNLD